MKKVTGIKKISVLLLTAMSMILFAPGMTREAKAADTDVVYIPDSELKAVLNGYLDVEDENADITQGQLAQIKYVSISSSVPVSDLTGLEYCTNLTFLSVYSKNEKLDISAIADLKQIKTISLDAPGIKDADLALFESCESLQSLSITTKSLTKLPEIPSLTRLYMKTGSSVKTDLSALECMTNLTSFELYTVESNDYTSIAKLVNLTTLSLTYCDIATLPDLSGLTEVKKIAFKGCDRLADISGLASCTTLTELSFQYTNNIQDITPIADLKNLTYLDLEETTAFDKEEYLQANLEAIAGLTKLETLHFPYCNVRNEHLYILDDMDNLKELTLNKTDITDLSSITHLFDTLTTLSVSDTDIDNGDIEVLAQAKKLKILGINETYITDFSFISQFPELTNNSVRFIEWTTSWPTITFSSCEKEVPDTVKIITVDNDIKDENGKLVAPVESDLYSYDEATGKIKIPVSNISGSESVQIDYSFVMTTQTGKTLNAGHEKTVKINKITYPDLVVKAEANKDVVQYKDKVTLTGIAEGGSEGYTYSYLVYNRKTKEWARLTPTFVDSNTFTWTAGSEGVRDFYVEVKDSVGHLTRSSAVTVAVENPELTIIGVTSSPKVEKGKKVTLTGTAAGGVGSYTYSYLVYNRDTKTWARLTASFKSSNTFTWTAGSAGTRDFYIEVKDSTGEVARSKAITIVTTESELGITGKASAATAVKGSKVTITGTATGGVGSYTYSYLVYNKTTNQWARLTASFKSSNTFTWTAGSAGTRCFYIEVKDSTGKVVRSAATTVVVK